MNRSNYRNHILKQIIPLYFWEPLNQNFSSFQESYKGVVKLILVNILKSMRNYKKIRSHTIPTLKKEIVFAYDGKPKKDVLIHLKDCLKHEICPPHSLMQNKEFSDLYFGYLGLHYSIHHLIWYFRLKGYERYAYRNKFWHCYYHLGMYRYVYKQLKKSKKAECFIGTNDHIGLGRMGFVASEKLDIKTVYIQHASVTDKFPPLIVDLALLDGADAKNKYQIAPNQSIAIKLIGSPKYDSALKSDKLHQRSDAIGVCLNMNPKEHSDIKNLCLELEKQNINFILRCHPHLNKKFLLPFEDLNWSFSDPNIEKETDFILNCKAIISGDSNILLDTIVLFRRPIYFNSSGVVSDYYGFLKNGVVDKMYQNTHEVIAEIKKSSYDITFRRQRAKYYIDSINSNFEGKSSEEAEKQIRLLLNK